MIINANALHIPLVDKCVHTIVTSPPYYGLRDYGTATWEGGDSECDHKLNGDNAASQESSTLGGSKRNYGNALSGFKHTCPHCGAIRIDAQIGLEQTPDEYIANLVSVFRECKRILRDDGTLWVNIGDSYAGSGKGCNSDGTPHPASLTGKQGTNFGSVEGLHKPQRASEIGLKSKDLIGIPWMLAFALRADGWYLRKDIIWAKPNPMPESVKDRCTTSHEYIFHLSKSAQYYYDYEAVMEDSVDEESYSGRRSRGPKSIFLQNGYAPKMNAQTFDKGGPEITGKVYGKRNKRDVWTVTTKPYKGAHFATFNPELIKPCILAGAPEGGIVFDPFVGSGTTVATAMQLGRKGIGLDLSLKYLHENATVRIDAARLPLMEMMEA